MSWIDDTTNEVNEVVARIMGPALPVDEINAIVTGILGLPLLPGQWRCGKCKGIYDYSVDFCPNDARPGPAAIMGY